MSALLTPTTRPSIRAVFGELFSSAQTADIAVGHIRLAALDLTERELQRVEQCRLIVARFDAMSLDTESFRADRDERIRRLLAFVESGRIRIRSAGTARWNPDFSCFRLHHDHAVLLGMHTFVPDDERDVAVACALRDAGSVRHACLLFDRLWKRGHDVLPAVRATLRNAVGCADD